MTMGILFDQLGKVKTKKKEFLAQMDRIVPWDEWLKLIKPCYYKGELGNKPYDLELMLRIYLIQNLYSLSDEATAAEIIDSRAFSDFCGVDSGDDVPDGDTIERFHNILLQNDLQEHLFTQMLLLLGEKGLIQKKELLSILRLLHLRFQQKNKEKKRGL